MLVKSIHGSFFLAAMFSSIRLSLIDPVPSGMQFSALEAGLDFFLDCFEISL